MDPDDFTFMLRNALPFDDTKAYRLMQIPSNGLIRANLDKLPASYTVLSMIARLDEEEFTARLDDGTLNPGTSRRTAEGFGKGKSKHHSEPDYARDIPGKGAKSDAQPSLQAADGDSPSISLAKRILGAAITLYQCQEELDPTLGIDHLLAEYSTE
jgi:hypothetical protein